MQRQRDGLVPIGDALSGMGGPVKSIREDPPQARRGFTVADQVNQLVGASEADADLGFMPRLLLAWVCTEAVRTQSRVLILGDSVSEFMRKLDIYSTSGEKYTRLRNQMGIIYLTHRVGLDARIGAAFGSKADVVLRFRFVDTDLPQVKRRIENRSIDLNELHSKATWAKHTY